MDTGDILSNDIASFLVDINALAIAFVIGIAIPWITEFVTHSTAPMWVRSVINFALSALAGVLTTLAIADYQSFGDYMLAIVFAWLATMRAHYAGLANPIAVATAGIGIGGRTPTSTNTVDPTV